MRDDGELTRARVLADPTRLRIVRLLREDDRVWTAAEVAAEVGVHRTSAAHHLAVLRDVGMVTGTTLAPVGRGRPRVGYRAAADEPHDGPFRLLSAALAEALATNRSPLEAGAEIGADVGRRLVDGDGGATDTLGALVADLERMGFEPDVRERRDGQRIDVVLHGCPLADVAAAHPEVVCALHQGLAAGIAESLGGLTVEGLRLADPHRGGCRLLLRRSDVE